MVVVNIGGTTFTDDLEFTSLNYAIGVEYLGGIIAYIFQPVDNGYVLGATHGLIAATSDQNSGIRWSNSKIYLNNVMGIGFGSINTTKIVESIGSGVCSASVCRTLGVDWYLPSQNELLKLYAVKSTLNMTGVYWSSTDTDTDNAVKVDFSNGVPSNEYKFSTLAVRAIRSF